MTARWLNTDALMHTAETILAAHSNPAMALRALQRCPEVRAWRDRLHEGALSQELLRHLVSGAMRGFRPGERLASEPLLAAICGVVAQVHNAFADEFLHDLARLKLAEMPMAIRVARECLKSRFNDARNVIKPFREAELSWDQIAPEPASPARSVPYARA